MEDSLQAEVTSAWPAGRERDSQKQEGRPHLSCSPRVGQEPKPALGSGREQGEVRGQRGGSRVSGPGTWGIQAAGGKWKSRTCLLLSPPPHQGVRPWESHMSCRTASVAFGKQNYGVCNAGSLQGFRKGCLDTGPRASGLAPWLTEKACTIRPSAQPQGGRSLRRECVCLELPECCLHPSPGPSAVLRDRARAAAACQRQAASRAWPTARLVGKGGQSRSSFPADKYPVTGDH